MDKKFQKGIEEHGEGWELIDHRTELLAECYDGMNYLEGLKAYNDNAECIKIQKLFIRAWELTQNLKTNPVCPQRQK
ncbi:hypothetical protein ACFL2K_01035 [Candidatus Margulisiibacteriota bacterium]